MEKRQGQMILRIQRITGILLLTGLLVVVLFTTGAQAATPRVEVLRVKGNINPVLVDYIKRGIEQAEDNRAAACIIQLDTPGGNILQNCHSAEHPKQFFCSVI